MKEHDYYCYIAASASRVLYGSRKLDLVDAFNPAWDDLSPREL